VRAEGGGVILRVTKFRIFAWTFIATVWVIEGNGICFAGCLLLPWLWCDL
jgi:hypothetical protein